MVHDRKYNILLAATGSVAAVKIPELAVRLTKYGDVKVICTETASRFLSKAEEYSPQNWESFQRQLHNKDNTCSKIQLLDDEDEWKSWNKIGDPVLHIELRQWADVLLIAPLSANSLAKIANGLCDNIVTAVARAWDFKKPLLIAPAMNTHMWNHPLTSSQLNLLQSVLKVIMIQPTTKVLACGESGTGALATLDTIEETLCLNLHSSPS